MSTRALGWRRRYVASSGVSSDEVAVSWWRLQGSTRSTAGITSPSERGQALHSVLAEAGAAVQVGQLEEESEPDDDAAERLDQAPGRRGRAARGEHVVDNEDPLAGVDRVAM